MITESIMYPRILYSTVMENFKHVADTLGIGGALLGFVFNALTFEFATIILLCVIAANLAES